MVPVGTVHDSTPLGPNGATVLPRFQHADAVSVAKGFSADGVSNTVVHSDARLSSSFFAVEALALGAATRSADALSRRIRVMRDMTTPPLPAFRTAVNTPLARDVDLINTSTYAANVQLADGRQVRERPRAPNRDRRRLRGIRAGTSSAFGAEQAVAAWPGPVVCQRQRSACSVASGGRAWQHPRASERRKPGIHRARLGVLC
jgi:hypothetical protein